MSKHHMPANVVTIIGTYDVVFEEVDRYDVVLLDQDPSSIASQNCLKEEKCNEIPDPIRNPNSEFVWIKFLCYTIPFSMMNRFDRLYTVIPSIDPIQYHQSDKMT